MRGRTDSDRRTRVGRALIAVLCGGVLSGCASLSEAVARHRPDLVVASITDPPPDGSTVESISVSVSTSNVGVLIAKNSVTRLFLSLDNQFSDVDVVLRDVSVPWLRRGTAPHVATVDVPLPATVGPAPTTCSRAPMPPSV